MRVRNYKAKHIWRPPNSAQLGGTPYHSLNLHLGPCSSVGMRRGTDTQTHIQTVVTTIRFASAMPHTKCNYGWILLKFREYTVSQKVPTFKQSVTLSNLNRFS